MALPPRAPLPPATRRLAAQPIAYENSGVTVGTSSTRVLEANTDRVYAGIVNDSDEAIYLALEDAAVLNAGIRLNAEGGEYEINATNPCTAAIFAICASGSKVLTVVEGTVRVP